MKVTKSRVLQLLAALVILLVYNTVFFALPVTREARHWISCGFSTLAIILTAVLSFYVLWRGTMCSKFYGLPILYVGWIYMPLQLAWGLVFMFVSPIPLWAGIIPSVALLMACVLGLVAVELGTTEIGRLDTVIKEKVFYIRSLQAEVETLAAKTTDGALKKALKEYAQAIRLSDPMSAPDLAELESVQETKTAAFKEPVLAGNAEEAGILCAELRQLLAERNRKCRLLKQHNSWYAKTKIYHGRLEPSVP
jgi:hypothetical protein